MTCWDETDLLYSQVPMSTISRPFFEFGTKNARRYTRKKTIQAHAI